MSKDLLIIFTRNPELGKCKTRLAATVGDVAALEIYKFLLNHTVAITKDLAVEKQVHYSIKVRENDIWNEAIFKKKVQRGDDLGARMQFAFEEGFDEGFERIIIIGSDMYDLNGNDIHAAFSALENHNFVIGPAEDGGYYLLGMTKMKRELFRNKTWGTNTVLHDTICDLADESVEKLPIRNDIDYYEDIKGLKVFDQFIDKISN